MSIAQGLSSKYYSGFNPVAVPGCALWLDAADSSTITLGTGTAITAWRDKSANTYTGTLVNSPTYSSNALNGRPAVSFNGTNQYINFGNNLNIGTSQIHVFAVLQYNSTADGAIIGKTSFRANAGRWALFRSAADGGLGFSIDVNGSGVGATARLADTNTTSRIVYGAWDRSVVSLLQTGVTLNSAALVNSSSLSNTDPLYIGAYPNSTGSGPQSGLFFNGIMGEVIVYLGNVSPSQREQIEGYLAWKWGFVRQSASSPSASFLPTSISNCALWLDAADSNTISFVSGSSISQWSDKSGNNKHAIQNVTGRYPTYSSNSVNGLSSVQTSSAGTTMFVPSLALTFPPTVIAVIQKTGTGGLGAAFIEHGPNTNSNSGFYMTPINSDFFSVRSPTGEQQFLDAAAGQGVAAFNATGVTYAYFTQVTPNLLRVNKITRTTTTTKNTGNPTGVVTDQLNIGSRNQTSLLGDARYCEIILYNRNITLSEILEIETYLTLKWGIAESLSSNHPYTNILPVTRPFVPLDIPDCALWLDAADPSTLTLSGSNVTQWNDKSGNGRNATQPSATSRPAYGTTNGRTAIVFSGSPTFMVLPSITIIPISIFVVTAFTQNINNTFLLALGNTNGAAIYVREQFSPDVFGIDNGTSGYNSSIKDLNTRVWSFTLPASANGVFLLDGNVIASSGFTFNANTTFANNTLGAWNQQSNDGNVRAGISEVLIYSSALTTPQRQQIEGYLSRKWGLVSSLPTIHDFKNVIPATAAFNPRQISNCRGWFDAADPSTLTLSNSSVTLWRDKSGGGFDLSQANSAWRPTYSNSELFFDGSTATGNHLLNATLTVAYESHTLFAVHRPLVDISKNTNIFRFQTGSGAYVIFPHVTAPGGVARGYVSTANTGINVAGSTLRDNSPLNQYSMISANISSGSQAVYRNGALQASSNVTLTSGVTPRLVIGAWQNTTTPQQPYYGNIRELLIFSSNLNAYDRTRVEGYLAWKWGLVNNLPNNHPYKKISPI
jgi:hypothetical protein